MAKQHKKAPLTIWVIEWLEPEHAALSMDTFRTRKQAREHLKYCDPCLGPRRISKYRLVLRGPVIEP